MTKHEFVQSLHDKLSGLPQGDVEERISFYIEMIEDRMEEGLSEEEAVASVGSVDEIVSQIIAEIPLAKIAKEKMKPKRRIKAWEILLLILGVPLWVPLLIAAASVAVSLYAAVWSVVVSVWAAFVSVATSAFAGVIAGIGFASGGIVLPGVALIGGGLFCAGLAVFLFFGSLAATKGMVKLTKKLILCIKKWFVKKEAKES